MELGESRRHAGDATLMDVTGYPKLARLLTLWHSRLSGRALPSRRDFAVEELREWLGNLVLVDVGEDGREFRYRVYGRNLSAVFGRELTNRTVDDLQHGLAATTRADYEKACRCKEPLFVEREAILRRKPICLKQLILPLSNDGGDVDQLMAAVYNGDLEKWRPDRL